MAKYTFTCSQGHEPKTMTVEAANDDEAMQKMMAMAKEHVAADHTGMPAMTDDDMMNMIKGGWKKEEAPAAEGGGMPPQGDMSGGSMPPVGGMPAA